MANTAKYILRTDRSKTVDVIVPLFAMATIVGTDGKNTELSRGEFDLLYEPALPKATLNQGGARLQSSSSAADEQLEKVLGYLTSLGGRIDEIGRKVDAIHGVAVVTDKGNSSEG